MIPQCRYPGGPGCDENATPDGPCCGQLVPIPKQSRLYDAWLFKSEEWQRRPLGLHPDAESALVEAKENHPDVVSVELAGEEDA